MAGPSIRRRKVMKKPYKGKFKSTRPSKNIKNNNNCFIKRSVQITTFGTSVGAGWSSIPLVFTANQLPGWSEIQALFDSYRINAVKLTLTPFWDGSDATQNGPAYTTIPRVYTLIDRNGFPAGSLASEALFLESSKCVQIMKPTEGFTVYVKNPGVEGAVATGSGFTANAKANFSPWLDTSNGNVEHYGAAVGIVIPAGSATSGWYYNINATFYMQVKNAV